MAKRKTIFDRIIRKVKRDSGTAWNKEWIGVLLAANNSADPIPDDALTLQGEDFFRTVQLEIKMSDFDELMRVESDEEAIVSPASWRHGSQGPQQSSLTATP